MRLRRMALLIVVLLLALGLSEALLPWLVSSRVEESLEQALGGDVDVTASVTGRPALAMLLGRYTDVRVTLQGVHAAGLRIDQLTLRSDQLTLPGGRLPESEAEWARALGGSTVEAVITQNDVNAYLVASRSSAADARVQLRPGRAMVTSPLKFAGSEMLVTAEGEMVLSNNGRLLDNRVDSVTVDDKQIPAFLVSLATDIVTVGVDLSRLPLGIVARSVEVMEGAVKLTGRTSQGV